jgi:multiple antibiotic resistance protein
MWEIALPAFVTFFVIIDPIGLVPIFGSLTAGTSKSHQRQMAFKAVIVGACVLLFFALAGKIFLSAMGISIDAFKASGGILLFLIAVEMIFEKRTERREARAEAVQEERDDADPEFEDVSIFPLGVPMVAGPGSIATVMLAMSSNEGHMLDQMAVLGALGLTLLITLVFFLVAGPLVNKMGPSLTTAFTRILGIILAAMAMQYIIDGVLGVVMA